jgi:hypothetical protein
MYGLSEALDITLIPILFVMCCSSGGRAVFDKMDDILSITSGLKGERITFAQQL